MRIENTCKRDTKEISYFHESPVVHSQFTLDTSYSQLQASHENNKLYNYYGLTLLTLPFMFHTSYFTHQTSCFRPHT